MGLSLVYIGFENNVALTDRHWAFRGFSWVGVGVYLCQVQGGNLVVLICDLRLEKNREAADRETSSLMGGVRAEEK